MKRNVNHKSQRKKIMLNLHFSRCFYGTLLIVDAMANTLVYSISKLLRNIVTSPFHQKSLRRTLYETFSYAKKTFSLNTWNANNDFLIRPEAQSELLLLLLNYFVNDFFS